MPCAARAVRGWPRITLRPTNRLMAVASAAWKTLPCQKSREARDAGPANFVPGRTSARPRTPPSSMGAGGDVVEAFQLRRTQPYKFRHRQNRMRQRQAVRHACLG